MAMKILEKTVRDSALITVTAIVMASIALLSLKTLVIPSDHAFDAFLPSVALGLAACFTLFARHNGLTQFALGVYLLAIGSAAVFLLWAAGFGGNDFDALLLLLAPLYLVVGSVLLVVSLLNHRHWMNSLRTTLVSTLLLVGPGALLITLFLFTLGSREWRTTPFGLDIIVATWIIGVGIFLAGSRFITKAKLEAHITRK
jgi:hypothetical protein